MQGIIVEDCCKTAHGGVGFVSAHPMWRCVGWPVRAMRAHRPLSGIAARGSGSPNKTFGEGWLCRPSVCVLLLWLKLAC